MGAKQANKRPRAGPFFHGLAQAVGLLDAAGFPVARELVEEDLYDEARRATGLSDFGDDHFREPFRIWVQSVRAEPHFTALSRMMARRRAVRTLSNRLRLRAQFQAHGEIAETPLRRPILIASLPRTGTTLLHKLLSQDPRARPLLGWESMQPVPLPADQGKDPDPRIRRARRLNKLLFHLAPAIRAVHNFDAEGAEECGLLLRNTFVSATDNLLFPQYRDWYLSQPRERLALAYREYCEQLQLLQYERPVPRDGHWVLKAPVHVYAIGAALQTIPDAAIVLLHRNPRQVMASFCSLLSIYFDIGLKHDEEHWRGLMQGATAWCVEGVRRVEEARKLAAPGRIFDVDYQQFVGDPLGTIRKIYDHFGYQYSPEFERRARAWLQNNPAGTHGKHRYRLEQFGLTEEAVDEAFASYRQRHGV